MIQYKTSLQGVIIECYRVQARQFYTTYAVAYAGFSKGGEGGRKFRKFENNEQQNENFFQPESVRLLA